MGGRLTFRPTTVPPAEHPAAIAWDRSGIGATRPESVDIFGTAADRPHNAKSSVYRLNGAGPGRGPIIAKRAGRAGIAVEEIIYREVLPQLPVPSPSFHGAGDDDDPRFAWIFLEEVEGRRYCEEDGEHRALAAEWLGAVHATTAGLDLGPRLPGYPLTRHLFDLERTRASILGALSGSAIEAGPRTALRSILGHCDAIERAWGAIEGRCRLLPDLLVHGDFIAKNVRVRAGESGPRLYAIDWESAGWGVAAEDLGALDHTIADLGGRDRRLYWSRLRGAFPHLGYDDLAAFIEAGVLFRYLAWVSATSVGLGGAGAPEAARDLGLYEPRLRACLRSFSFI